MSITKFDVLSHEEREPGFIITSYWNQQYVGMVFILDSDGDIVWWFNSEFASGVSKATMSDDGKSMWMITGSAALNEPLKRVGDDPAPAGHQRQQRLFPPSQRAGLQSDARHVRDVGPARERLPLPAGRLDAGKYGSADEHRGA